MRKNETVNTFSQEYDERIKSNKINECSWFGICLGLIMLAVGLYQSLCTVGLWCVFYKIICGIGLLLLLIGSFFPGVLNKPVHLIKNVFSVVGKYLLRLLLLPIYLAFAIMNIFVNKKYSHRFKYISWEEDAEAEPKFDDYIEITVKKGRYAIFDTIDNTLLFFAKNKTYIAIPVVLILLILGMMMFFASSSAVFSFVYTLF